MKRAAATIGAETEGAGAETLPLLYRDDCLVAVNKPSGLLVHRSPIDRHETRFALQLLRDQLGQRVYPVHRLDKPTSGVLLFALDSATARRVSDCLADGQVDKTYLAVVRGFSPQQGLIDHPLRPDADAIADRNRSQARPLQAAQTRFRRLAQVELPVAVETYPQSRYSLLECQPLSGRKHQLRRHLKHINHPIIGDAKHGRGRHNRYFRDHLDCPRLALHAARLQLPHPLSGEPLDLNAPLDASLQQLLARFGWLQAIPAAWHQPAASHTCPEAQRATG